MSWQNRWLSGPWLAPALAKFLRRLSDDARKPKRKQSLRLLVEEMEGRVLLSATPLATTSSNWSGYAAQTNLNTPLSGAVTAVGGSWVVPTVTGSVTGYSSAWVGIDGYSSSTVEQIGTEQDTSINGKTTYYAWYEMYPAGSVLISNFKVAPGDLITAEVLYASGAFTLRLTNMPSSGAAAETFSITKTAKGALQSSAEWIIEAPSAGSTLPLANFGTINFSNAWATISGASGPIDNAAWQASQINMVGSSSRHGPIVTEDTTSGLTGGAPSGADPLPPATGTAVSSFSVTFNASATPPPPTSRHHGLWWAPDQPAQTIIVTVPVTATMSNALLIVHEPVLPTQRVLLPAMDIRPQAAKPIDSSGITRLGIWHETNEAPVIEADEEMPPVPQPPQAAPAGNEAAPDNRGPIETPLSGALPSAEDVGKPKDLVETIETNMTRPQPDLEALAASAGVLLFLRSYWQPEQRERKKQRRIISDLWRD